MDNTPERRTSADSRDDEFSPEFLAMLVLCGGTVRDSDWAVLPEAIAARRFEDRGPASRSDPSRDQ